MGMRSLLELLDAKRELFRSEIAALFVERDHFIAQFVLASEIGQATPIA